jgi:hypothetical protein
MSGTATNTPGQASASPDPAQESTSLERMARVRRLVRQEGKSADEAAQLVGVDPIIAQLWLRLPDDLWSAGRAGLAESTTAAVASPAPPPAAPLSGLRRVITCRVPTPAYDRLRAGTTPLLEAAAQALDMGLSLPRPEPLPGGWRFARRPLAIPVSGPAYEAIGRLAADAFDGDLRDAAGWLVARGAGMAIPLPTADELAGVVHERAMSVAPARSLPAVAPPARFVVPPRRRPETRAPLPPDDSAPNGDELRTRREAIGISQRDLAAASGLSRGLVAEIERGRRRHVLTRLRLSETLASLERSK